MSFGIKLFIFVFSALLLDLVPLELILRSQRNDLATGQMIGLFVLIALVTCTVSGVATYRHFRETTSARILVRTANASFFIVMAFFYLFSLVHFIEKTNHSGTGWHWLKIIELLEYIVLMPCLIYLLFWLNKMPRNGSRESSKSSR
jgi:Ca2+/Na+ antiporter